MDTKITNTDDKIEITIVWPDRPAEIDHKILAYWDKTISRRSQAEASRSSKR